MFRAPQAKRLRGNAETFLTAGQLPDDIVRKILDFMGREKKRALRVWLDRMRLAHAAGHEATWKREFNAMLEHKYDKDIPKQLNVSIGQYTRLETARRAGDRQQDEMPQKWIAFRTGMRLWCVWHEQNGGAHTAQLAQAIRESVNLA